MGKRCEGTELLCKKRKGDEGAGDGKTKRESYFRRIQKYHPCGQPAAEEGQGSVLEDLIARRASSRNRSSMSSSFRNTRKKRGPTWTRGHQKVVDKETG